MTVMKVDFCSLVSILRQACIRCQPNRKLLSDESLLKSCSLVARIIAFKASTQNYRPESSLPNDKETEKKTDIARVHDLARPDLRLHVILWT